MNDTLLAAVIHDTKNRLGEIDVCLRTAQQEHDSPALLQARAAVAGIGRQLVEMLALYRAGNGCLRLAIDDHDLADFCADLQAAFEPPPGRPLRLEFASANAIGIGAWAFDAYQVALVLQDALRNAARHARHEVRCELSLDQRGLRFCIRDDGAGYPAAILDGELSAMGTDGSGLGLAFAQQIAHAHATPDGRHGRIELYNAAGACFNLILP